MMEEDFEEISRWFLFSGFCYFRCMITGEKIKEIRKSLRNGTPEGEIREALKKEGYSRENIDKVFTPCKYDMRSWYISFAIILLIAGIWAYINYESILLFILSALLFFSYFNEVKRLRKG